MSDTSITVIYHGTLYVSDYCSIVVVILFIFLSFSYLYCQRSNVVVLLISAICSVGSYLSFTLNHYEYTYTFYIIIM